jgi:biotin transport system substrate-specific component
MSSLDPWHPPYPSLVDSLWPAPGLPRLARPALLTLAGVGLLYLGGRAQVPLWPVPLTLQDMVVLLLAMAGGPWLGLASVGGYLALGLAGLPVFAGTPERGLGLAYMSGPMGGYLAGFGVAAAVVGHGTRLGWDRSLRGALAAGAAGMAAIHLCGLLRLAALLGWAEAWTDGVLPFLVPAIVKGGVVAVAVATAWAVRRRRRRLW